MSSLQKLDALKTAAAKEGVTMTMEGGSITFSHGAGISAADVTDMDGSDDAAADAGIQGGGALAAIATAKEAIGSIAASLGTASKRLDMQQEFTQVLIDTFEEGLGILVDANLAEESAKLQALQTKESLGIQSLSIANQRPQSIMSLFKG